MDTDPQAVAANSAAASPTEAPRRSLRPLVAVGCVLALVAVVLASRWSDRNDARVSTPPFAVEQEIGDAIDPPVEDPRTHPGFDEAYGTVCEQTVAGLDAMYAAAAAGAPDLMATIDGQYQALTQRIETVYARTDLWDATDPLVLEYAESIVDDLASILDGTDTGFEYLDGDVTLFRSLCDDWFAPR